MKRAFAHILIIMLIFGPPLAAPAQTKAAPKKSSKPAVPKEAEGAPAKKEAAPAKGIEGDDDARGMLEKSFAFQQALKTYQFTGKMNMKMNLNGMDLDNKMQFKMVVEKPNKFSIQTEGEGMMAMAASNAVSDGAKLYTSMPMYNQYTVADAPKDMNDISSQLGGSMAGMSNMLGSLSGSVEDMMAGVKDAQYLGVEDLGGVKCHHLQYKQTQGELAISQEVWIEAGDRPVMRKIVPDFSNLAEIMNAIEGSSGAPPEALEMMKDMKMEMTMLFTEWRVNEKISPELFKFTPPEGAKLVEEFTGPMAAAGGDESEPAEDDSAAQLVGKPAPTFKLEVVDGKPFDLAEQKGKKIVVLDFWATWCGPCRKAMPIVDKVVKSFADRGVILVTVNLEESAEDVREFMKKEGLSVTVALDKKNDVGQLYKANSIPQTVIIGKDGEVKKAHIGFSKNLEKDLAAELEEIVGQ